MNWLLILPILLPLFTAIAMLLVWQRTAWKRWLGVVGTAGLLIRRHDLADHRLAGGDLCRTGG